MVEDLDSDIASRAATWWAEVGGSLPVARLGENGDHGDTGEPIKVLYARGDVDFDDSRDLGVPGYPPFTRSAFPSGYRKRPWQMVQYAGFGTAEETNERWKTLLSAGQKHVSLAFDLPSHLGLDSDDPRSEDEVGKAGTAVDTLADLEVLFDGIDIAQVPATFNTAAIAPIVTAMYQVLGEKMGVVRSRLAGTITNDPLSACHRGTVVLPSQAGVKLAGDVIEYCVGEMPRFTPINVQGVYMRSVGATKAQEVAYTFSNAFAYLEDVRMRGLDLELVAPRFSAFLQCDSHIFEEAAKFRAARRTWAALLFERFGLRDDDSRRFRATGVSAPRCFTKEEPYMNLVRGAFSALGCALGGVQGMWISGFDEALATPTEEASRLALRTMQILAEETGVTATIDPLGGGFYIEHLTNRMEQMIRELVLDIDAHGGAIAASDSGYMRQQMSETDMEWMLERESGQRRIVGHNYYPWESPDPDRTPFQRFRTEVKDDQIAKLREVKRNRHERAVAEALHGIRNAAISDENTMRSIIIAVREYATVGEIMNVFREVWGEWKEPSF